MQKVLFVDRDGTLVIEPPVDCQLDSLEKLEFYPGVFQGLSRIAQELDFKLVMVSNQDGLGTDSFPEATFWPAQNKILDAFKNEGVVFDEVLIDKSFLEENANTRKPRTGLLSRYIYGNYDLANSYVIGDRLTDVELANNLGCKSIYLGEENSMADLTTNDWSVVYSYLKQLPREAKVVRTTKETQIECSVNLDGNDLFECSTGIAFFDHMLEQISKHGNIDLFLNVKGDLAVDEHHTIEDVALTLGETFNKAIGSKKGMERYGFLLPMDDCLAQVAIDFGGRSWLVWKADFKREIIGEMPTEMFMHFFKSFSDAAQCNLNIQARGNNEHHKIESIFKAFAKAIKMAITKNEIYKIPSTKGVL